MTENCRSLPDQFAVGDRVRVLTGLCAGKVGTIDRRAHSASPWRWVVRSWPDNRLWASATNDEDMAREALNGGEHG